MTTELKHSTRQTHRVIFAACLTTLVMTAICCWAADGILVEIEVAPNVLNLESNGTVVTVHTDIPYGDVAATTVTLNGIPIDHWKADNRGNFVAKFLMDAIKDLPLDIGGMNTLTLEGQAGDDSPFSGSCDIRVVRNLPKKK